MLYICLYSTFNARLTIIVDEDCAGAYMHFSGNSYINYILAVSQKLIDDTSKEAAGVLLVIIIPAGVKRRLQCLVLHTAKTALKKLLGYVSQC